MSSSQKRIWDVYNVSDPEEEDVDPDQFPRPKRTHCPPMLLINNYEANFSLNGAHGKIVGTSQKSIEPSSSYRLGSAQVLNGLGTDDDWWNRRLLSPHNRVQNAWDGSTEFRQINTSSPHLSELSLGDSNGTDNEMDIDTVTASDFHCISNFGKIAGNRDTHLKSVSNHDDGMLEVPPVLDFTISEELCFGMIFAKASLVPGASIQDSSAGGEALHLVRRKLGHYSLWTPSTEEVAIIDMQTRKCLDSIFDLESIRIVPYFYLEETPQEPPIATGKTQIGVKGRSKGKTVTANYAKCQLAHDNIRTIILNLYGKRAIMEQVAKELSLHKKHLQEPDNMDISPEQYHNPHEYHVPGRPKTKWMPRLQRVLDADSERNALNDVLNSLNHNDTLEPIDGGTGIKTELLDHQKSALCFTIKAESPKLADTNANLTISMDFRIPASGRHENYFKGHDQSQRQLRIVSRGGILADDMGLGKTLTMLATIVRFKMDGQIYASRGCSKESNMGPRTRGTLVIVPLSLLSEWESEIKRHVVTGHVTFYIYHGKSSRSALSQLQQYDIVLTTYTTLAGNCTKSGQTSPLFKLNWFRVILDEAHSIRNQNTNIFRSAMALTCQRRWCLTGTPIQNKIDDLHSLLRFLRIPHFQERAYFQQHIIDMLKYNSVQGLENLQVLMSSCCLRRTRMVLPSSYEIHEELRILEPSSTERKAYEDITRKCKENIHQLVNNKGSKKVYLTIIQTITHLRRLCNNGSIAEGQGKEHDMIDSCSDSRSLDPIDVLDSFQRMESAFCVHCQVDIESLIDDQAAGFGYITTCYNLVCGRCTVTLVKCKDKYNTCQFCGERQAQGESHFISFPNVRAYQPPYETKRSGPDAESEAMDTSLDNDAPSSKISALLVDVRNHPIGCKSIVFSGWTTTLDLIENSFKTFGITYLRVDGKTNAASRKAILEEFRGDEGKSVLLMTTGCGATGLNLTVASRVHLVEPQWNPMLERQAIGRVARIGQEKGVIVYRYIMRGTLEESVRSRQLQKTALAEVVSDIGSGAKKDMMIRMEALKLLL